MSPSGADLTLNLGSSEPQTIQQDVGTPAWTLLKPRQESGTLLAGCPQGLDTLGPKGDIQQNFESKGHPSHKAREEESGSAGMGPQTGTEDKS